MQWACAYTRVHVRMHGHVHVHVRACKPLSHLCYLTREIRRLLGGIIVVKCLSDRRIVELLLWLFIYALATGLQARFGRYHRRHLAIPHQEEVFHRLGAGRLPRCRRLLGQMVTA